MPKIISLDQIKNALATIDVLPLIEKGFVEYSKGNVVVPPVGELLFDNPPGDVHIKYGAIKNDDFYVIKIASGFSKNTELFGISPLQGLMLIYNQKSGEPLGVLLDEGHLTQVRTAAAGAIMTKYLAPKVISNIGIIGTGLQAREQLLYLKQVVSCRSVLIWGRSDIKLQQIKEDMQNEGFSVVITSDMDDLTSKCNLIVTTTSANTELIKVDQIMKGTHITAMGSDTLHKQELDPEILKIADKVIVDSISQSKERGEVYHALKKGIISEDKLIEIGNMIENKTLQRNSDEEITIADLTGVAVQDIQITKAVYLKLQD
ncbi:MAG: Alanine dehydrogenase [Candidatus Heimdallarchaeota archaeon LC_2]|nr:MAG: Alanine dehydrogenase [Candidatus Heimdallarchaeota archaeon LC_2]